MTCTCFSSHGVRHRCQHHLEWAFHDEDYYVPADNCRVCAAFTLEEAEHRLETAKQAYRVSVSPRPTQVPSPEQIKEHARRLGAIGL